MNEITAVEWLFEQLPDHFRLSENGFDMLQQAKEMEQKQAHLYAEFAIMCDRKNMKILNFDGYINLKTES